MSIKNLPALLTRIDKFSDVCEFGYICIGYGGENCELRHQFNINALDLYRMENRSMSNGFSGNDPRRLYFIATNFYKENILLMNPFTRIDAITKAESLIGKTVKGTKSVFTVETYTMFGKVSLPTWLNYDAKNLIEKQGWVVIVEDSEDFAIVTIDMELVNGVKLNDEYTAIIDGDYVQVGCQKIHKDKVIELANLLK